MGRLGIRGCGGLVFVVCYGWRRFVCAVFLLVKYGDICISAHLMYILSVSRRGKGYGVYYMKFLFDF